MLLQRDFSVEINQKNKIALRHQIDGILNQKLNYDGLRSNEVIEFSFEVDPQENFKYMSIE
jgi:hypothetical protein